MTSAPGWLGRELHRFDVIGSTSDEAARRAREGASHGTVVVADRQTAGRGRQGRNWWSPAGENLYFSVVLRLPGVELRHAPPVTLAAGVAVCDASRTFGVDCGLKWPNDVVVQDRKMAGILTETSVQGSAVQAVIVGIGVDVNGVDFPDDLRAVATSMRRERGGEALDRDAVLARILGSLETWVDRFVAGGPTAVVAAWRARAVTLGRRVVGDGVDGVAVDVDDEGGLWVELADGNRKRVVAGEVRHV